MKQTIFGIILGVLLVVTVSVGFELHGKYEIQTANDYVAPTEFTVDVDGIKYRQKV
ncbi:MAG: Unknown protein [uncultured Sulfurovum sp.]|uniref:Uncharacterized protein n=1 Tax=uncultured Sulfurovum sp. TaxID=269237 RepID=A0A6S6SVX7_9BACT|nr:MAG: Unknown protein [uncultured Sulfurovum sp.]